ncbi:hypothetical protein [Dactylosporangium matsuzakiense]|uniref:Ribulose 1,5-bisphosphate carboxylase large subunit n=1 Tax=Dactylosporangium matsuzakiense TaxID=53360 RepID=A0A9W6KLH8_9ACTN|nr:hypothetical protein [Dactylosporangium matsuzakiense]GLL02436.1 hypothetical protein GCM10017581_041780 [Dactylosporangium matsuzakiense]
MPLPLPRLSNVVDLAMSAAGTAVGTVAAVAALPGRVVRLVDGAELLLARATVAVDAVDETIAEVRAAGAAAAGVVAEAERTSGAAAALVAEAQRTSCAAAAHVAEAQRTSGAAAELVTEAARTSSEAAAVVVRAAQTAGTADGLISAYEPSLQRFVDNLSADEVTAAIRMVDELPRLAHHLNTDVMPILATLDRVGPDIHELLNVTRDLRQAIIGIPGFGMLRRRGAASETDGES